MKPITITDTEVKTQKDAILWHLANYGQITSWESIQQYGATRLADIIYKLRKEGYHIEATIIKTKNRFGRNTSIAKYVYTPPPQEFLKNINLFNSCEINK